MNSLFSCALIAGLTIAKEWTVTGPIAYDRDDKEVISVSYRYEWEVHQETKTRHYNMSWYLEMHNGREL